MQNEIKKYAHNIVGPVVFNYTRWVLDEAKKRGISKLYFLARDAYLPYEIAKLICEKESLKIECKYLFCSRQSLRTPTYHLIGEEALDLLLLGGYNLTPKTIIERLMPSDDEVKEIYKELDISDPDKHLSQKEFENFKSSLKSSVAYNTLIFKKSTASYSDAISYFTQEGLFDGETVAIVDSGWTGSMQRSIRQLMESAGYLGKFIGFYFGMYVEPKDTKDGDYLNFYFDAKSGTKRKVSFNNNLFECMLSADHPMTVGYKTSSDNVSPIFANVSAQDELVKAQISGALDYVRERLSAPLKEFASKHALKETYKILRRAMMFPDKNFAKAYGKFAFCDDVTEAYHISLASPEMRTALSDYMLLPRIFRKIFKLKKTAKTELFWPYGVIAFCPAILRPWYRFNVRAWEFLKAILHK